MVLLHAQFHYRQTFHSFLKPTTYSITVICNYKLWELRTDQPNFSGDARAEIRHNLQMPIAAKGNSFFVVKNN